MAADGRLVTFSVTVSDRPGGIAELARYTFGWMSSTSVLQDHLQLGSLHQGHRPRAGLGQDKRFCCWGKIQLCMIIVRKFLLGADSSGD